VYGFSAETKARLQKWSRTFSDDKYTPLYIRDLKTNKLYEYPNLKSLEEPVAA
jgi:hypothetical protein